MHAPAGSARLVVGQLAADTFLEFALDVSGAAAAGRRPRQPHARRQGVIVDERPIAAGKAVAELTDDDVRAVSGDGDPEADVMSS